VTESDLLNNDPGVVTVYGDLACPFATLAIAGLRAARDRVGRDVRLDIRAFPLELINRHAHDIGLLETEKAVLGTLDPGMGWRRWRGAVTDWPVSTLLAMEAVQAAKRPEVGGLPASEELDVALRRALYVESRSIGLLPVILEVAEECAGVDRTALGRVMHAGTCRPDLFHQLGQQERGAVNGSPHVFTPDGRDWVNPGLTIEHSGDYVVVREYDRSVLDEIILAA
jgi:predicted DsbA family dithiol-disulfide isomerase